MGRCITRASNLCDTSVSGHDYDGSLVALKSSVKEGEALDV